MMGFDPNHQPTRSDVSLSENAKTVLERRYLARDEHGDLVETPEQLFRRVANAVAKGDLAYGASDYEVAKLSDQFYEMMASLDFLPNSPTLGNAGRPLGQLSACFVLPIEDSISSIFEAVKQTALIHKSGGGTGFAFSRIRPAGSIVNSSSGVASGPVSFMRIFDAATEQIKQGGTRRGANMGILRIDHPDIKEFIQVKSDHTSLQNFNISVAVTDEFMQALQDDRMFDLRDPRYPTKSVWTLAAKDLWNLLIENAWLTGDPGVVFIDRINAADKSGDIIEATNPCVTGDTLIYTDHGLRTAKELHEDGAPVRVYGSDGQLHGASEVFKTGHRPVFRLRTVEGYEVRLTAEHKVYTQKGWTPASSLSEGDTLLLYKAAPVPQSASAERDLALGKLLGWLVGDGTITKDRAVLSFFGEKRELAGQFSGMLQDTVEGRSIGVVNVKGKDESRVSSLRFLRIAEEFGLSQGDKHKVPEGVLTGSREMQRGFLQGLFSADGHVDAAKSASFTVRLTSISPSLLRDVQRMLLSFGIACRIYDYSKYSYYTGTTSLPDGYGGHKQYQTKPFEELAISKQNVRAFADEIGFLNEGKQTKLLAKLAGYTKGPRAESFTARFLSLTAEGEEDVYDLTERVTHAFIANGIITHNCGEQPLGPYDACNLGSINMANFAVRENKWTDWARLGKTIELAVHFLDNVIEINKYPLAEIEEKVVANRRIGLGIMGFADYLCKLEIPYDSNAGLSQAGMVAEYLKEYADASSQSLAGTRGVYPAIYNRYYVAGRTLQPKDRYRNCMRTTIAPTGTISLIADCSSGIEPLFALAFMRQHNLDRTSAKPVQMYEVNKHFLDYARDHNFYSSELIDYLVKGGSIQSRADVPDNAKEIFATAYDISPEWHVKMQAAFQKHIDSGVSKTINLPRNATPSTVDQVYRLAYQLGCKGVTIYRDGSHENQVLSTPSASASDSTPTPTSTLTSSDETTGKTELEEEERQVLSAAILTTPGRRLLPSERLSITHKASIGGQTMYITVGLYGDNTPGEVFIKASKQGSTVQGLCDSVAQLMSVALQYGVPLKALTKQMKSSRFEPSGLTATSQVPTATSLVDYIAQYLEWKFPTPGQLRLMGEKVSTLGDTTEVSHAPLQEEGPLTRAQGTGNVCPDCGGLLTYAEGCELCHNCGYSKCG